MAPAASAASPPPEASPPLGPASPEPTPPPHLTAAELQAAVAQYMGSRKAKKAESFPPSDLEDELSEAEDLLKSKEADQVTVFSNWLQEDELEEEEEQGETEQPGDDEDSNSSDLDSDGSDGESVSLYVYPSDLGFQTLRPSSSSSPSPLKVQMRRL